MFEKKILLYHSKQKGMILPSVLFFLTCLAFLSSQFLATLPLGNRFMVESHIKKKEFQVAQIGLKRGEAKVQEMSLEQLIALENKHIDTFKEQNISVTLFVKKLPQRVCVLPQKNMGHYYQITASAQSYHLKATDKKGTCLQSVVLIVDTHCICPLKAKKRTAGRSAWCQLA